jgi:hypothetical protein
MSSTQQAEIDGNMLRDWHARDYLDYYYGRRHVPEDEAVMLRFVAQALRDIGRHFDRALDLGCGPVLHRAAQLVPWVDRLDMADFQESNLEEVRSWLRGDSGAFDWSVFIGGEGGVLAAEGRQGSSLREREALMRARIQIMRCDLRDPVPLGRSVEYPLVASHYCTEWVVPSVSGWLETMRRVLSLVSKDGWLILSGVHATDYCVINGRRVPSAHLTGDAICRALEELGCDRSSIRLEVTPGLAPSVSGIQGTFMAYARRGR